MLRATLIATAAAVALAAGVSAQTRDRGANRSDCDRGGSDRASWCEVREDTINGANPLDVDTGGNGGITVRGSDRADVHMRARIVARADTEAEARQIASGVRVETSGGTVRADGPRTDRDTSWSVTIELDVPRNMILTLNTRNGGISLRD